jgi:hypothetical protein
VKHSRLLFGFFAVLGIVFLTLVLAGLYLDYVDAVNILASLNSQLGLWFVLGGIISLTVGVIGMGRQHFKNHRNLFTSLAVVLIPMLTLAIMFVASVEIVVYAPMFPMRSEITQVAVVDTSPLILSLNVKALTSRDTTITGAIIKNYYGQFVTGQKPIVSVYDEKTESYSNQSICELPAGSTISLTLEYTESLSSGNYTVMLFGGMDSNQGSSPFTIP